MRTVSRVMSLILLAQGAGGFAQSASAQQAKSQPPFVGMVPPLVANPGEYNITSSDTSKLKTDLLARIGKVQDSDKEYLDQVIQAMIDATNRYNTLLIAGDFKKLSDQSVNNQFVDYKDFLAALNEIRSTKAQLQTKKDLLTSAAHALPSDATIADEKSPQKVPAPRNIDFSAVTKAVDEKVASAEAIANAYPFTLVVKDSKGHVSATQFINLSGQNEGSALNPKVTFPAMSQEQVAQLQDEAKRLSTPPDDFERFAENYAIQLKRLINQFITNYGREEAYRFHDEAFAKARADQLKDIANAFWGRSYLRMVYGVPVGAIIPAHYQKRWANVDRFTVLTEALSQFQEAAGPSQIRDEDLKQAVEDYRQILGTLDARSAAILSGDASVLSRLNSLITLMKGDRPTAEAMVAIMQLMAADLNEEVFLRLGSEGLPGMMRFYDARWNSTPADEKVTKDRVCAFDYLDNLANGRSNCYMGTAQTGILGTFNNMNKSLNLVSKGLDQAAGIQKQIQLEMLASSLSGGGVASGVGGRRGGGRRL